MADEQIDHWIDGLAGKPGAEITPDEAAEIERLQTAILAHALEEANAQQRPTNDVFADQRAWQRIKLAIDLDRPTQSDRARRLPWPALSAVAGLLVALSITWWQLSGRYDDIVVVQQAAPQYHGTVPVIEVVDSGPLLSAKRLAKHLIPLATKPTVYFHNGRATVEFELTDVQLATVSKELTTQGIQSAALAAGIVQVQFLPR